MNRPLFLLAIVCALGGCAATAPAPVTQAPAAVPAPVVYDSSQTASVMNTAPSADTQAPRPPQTLVGTFASDQAIQRDRILTLYNQAMEASRSALAKGQYAEAKHEAEYAVQLVDENRNYLAMTESQRLVEQARALKSAAAPQ